MCRDISSGTRRVPTTGLAVDNYGKTRMILAVTWEGRSRTGGPFLMARPRHEQPTPAELEILKILWTRGTLSVRECSKS